MSRHVRNEWRGGRDSKQQQRGFFTELKLGDGPKKIYPAGRKNLSRKWQEWLADADEEFMKVEKEANRLIKSRSNYEIGYARTQL